MLFEYHTATREENHIPPKMQKVIWSDNDQNNKESKNNEHISNTLNLINLFPT